MTDVPEPEPGADALRRPHPSRLDPRRPDYDAVIGAHDAAMDAGQAGYEDPTTGMFVMTASYLLGRGSCCDQGCRHCPYLAR